MILNLSLTPLIFVFKTLQSTKSPKEFAEGLVKDAHRYNGFNLVLADISSKSMVYLSNRPKGEPVVIQEVSPGLHVLSNANLDSPSFLFGVATTLLPFPC